MNTTDGHPFLDLKAQDLGQHPSLFSSISESSGFDRIGTPFLAGGSTGVALAVVKLPCGGVLDFFAIDH